ncbi:MAG TPA: choice-of-anchor tandem repeat GloVer-containing protein [Candidatus Solibacter sp.]|nr:choice-of-anchor tandem repeat GloVer-containing protein [Candidatus Solibacter sp.]
MKTARIAAMLLLALAAMLPAYGQTFTALHQFNSQNDGAEPQGSVIRDSAGNIFGTTTNPSTIFKIDAKLKESVLFNINGSSLGDFPTGSLTQDAAGNLYGIAEGGSGGAGVIYKLSPQGQETILFAFQGGLHNTTPKSPAGGVLLGKNGNIFGAAQFGNKQKCFIGCGSIFRLDSTGTMHFLHVFTGGIDGANPIGPLVQDAAGNLYGVAQSGGDLTCPEFFLNAGDGCGVVFKIATDHTFTVLHTFAGGADGAVPQGGLLLDKNGNLFGTAVEGGIAENGTVYEIAQDGTYTVVHRFTQAEAKNPNGGLVEDASGNLFGTAQLGGDQNLGTVFQLNTDESVKVLHNFAGLDDGAVPFAGLFRDSAGNLYGTTVKNFLVQIVQGGNVFKVTP